MCLELALEGERLCKSGDCRAGVAFFQVMNCFREQEVIWQLSWEFCNLWFSGCHSGGNWWSPDFECHLQPIGQRLLLPRRLLQSHGLPQTWPHPSSVHEWQTGRGKVLGESGEYSQGNGALRWSGHLLREAPNVGQATGGPAQWEPSPLQSGQCVPFQGEAHGAAGSGGFLRWRQGGAHESRRILSVSYPFFTFFQQRF